KERNVRAAQALKEQALLENACREAEAIGREARLQASEEGVKVRAQIEKSFAIQKEELISREARFAEREALLNRQLENLVQEEKNLRHQQQEWQKKADALDLQNKELSELMKQRRGELRNLSHLTEADARAQFMKEIEAEALGDGNTLARRIVDEAKSH